MARKVFNSPTFVKPCVVDVAIKLLRPTNWVFLDGKEHIDYRKGLNGLFTRQALEAYLPGQEEVYDKYFARAIKISEQGDKEKGVPFMPFFRELMCAVSCRTFVGHYLSDNAVKKIADDYWMITAALELVNFPIILPFTKTWYGKKAADMVLEEFANCAAKSKARMAVGGDITCIMDAWVKSMIDSAKYNEKIAKGIAVDPEEKPATLVRDFSDFEISQTVFTFLFASQDATSSACTWLFQIMADRPEILDRVRAENLTARNGDKDVPFSMDLLENLPYTRAVVKELLRYRPPVIMVPYVVKKPFPITDSYTAPKGSMIIPSCWPALHDPEVYPNPDSYDPNRWISGDAESKTKNWLVFGTGPHYCLGQTYAQLNLIGMIGKASLCLDWSHKLTERSEDIEVFATLFPQVSPPSEARRQVLMIGNRITARWSSQSDHDHLRRCSLTCRNAHNTVIKSLILLLPTTLDSSQSLRVAFMPIPDVHKASVTLLRMSNVLRIRPLGVGCEHDWALRCLHLIPPITTISGEYKCPRNFHLPNHHRSTSPPLSSHSIHPPFISPVLTPTHSLAILAAVLLLTPALQ